MVKAPATDTRIGFRFLPDVESGIPERELRANIKNAEDDINSYIDESSPINSTVNISFDTESIGNNNSEIKGIDIVVDSPIVLVPTYTGFVLSVLRLSNGLESSLTKFLNVAKELKVTEISELDASSAQDVTTPGGEDITPEDLASFAENEGNVIISAEPVGKFGGPRPVIESTIGFGVIPVEDAGDRFIQKIDELREIEELSNAVFDRGGIGQYAAFYLMTDSDTISPEALEQATDITEGIVPRVIVGESERL